MATADVAARRYATALLEVADPGGMADRCLADLQAFQREVARIPELQELVGNPSVPRDALARVVAGVASAMKLHELATSFLSLVATRRRLVQLPAILDACADELDRRAGRARGVLVSAGPVTAPQVQKVRDAIGRALDRQLILTQRLDPTLLSGLRVTVGDKVFDLSARTWLDSLRSHLLENR